MSSNQERLTQARFNELYTQLSGLDQAIELINSNPLLLNQVTPTTPPVIPQAVNMLRNASFSHSVKSWFNTGSGDTQYECYPWYSHPDIENQPMVANTAASPAIKTFTNTDVDTGTDIITIIDHGFGTGTAVLFTSASPPNPLVTATVYYVIRVDADTFRLATSATDAFNNVYIDITTTGGAVVNTLSYDYTLKSSSATGYVPYFSIWDISGDFAGTAAINQGYTLDAPLTSDEAMASPGYTLYSAINCAKINQYISAPDDARLGCGLYAEQDGMWDYLTADYDITATVRDPVTGGGTSRDYMVHITTNRGFTVNTNVLTVAAAPRDVDFTNGAGVVLNWQKALNYGVLAYSVYRKTGSTYLLLARITNGTTSYIDNNSYIDDTPVAFPSADFTGLFTYTATIPGVLTNLAIDGISPAWDVLPFALRVPANYDVSLTDITQKQWIRWDITGLTDGRFDIRLTDCIVLTGGNEITSVAGQFNSDMSGKTITITSAFIVGGSYTGVVDNYVSPTEIKVTPSVDLEIAADTPVALTVISGGAPLDAVVFDLAQCSYGSNAVFSFNPQDADGTHGTPPVAPNGSNQGGTGPIFPNPGDGQPTCVWVNEFISVVQGLAVEQVKAGNVEKGDVFISKKGILTKVDDIKYDVNKVWRVETANGHVAHITDTHKFLRDEEDINGAMLQGLKVGDTVDTIDGLSEIVEITPIKDDVVVQFFLSPSHEFLVGGIASHNSKPVGLVT